MRPFIKNRFLKELLYPLFLVLVIFLVAKFDSSLKSKGEQNMTLEISSPAFNHNHKMPPRFTCDGEDISPPIAWGEAPEGTKSFAIIHDDPDASIGTWVHWVVYNIPPEIHLIVENSVPKGAVEGVSDFGKASYGGACPPSGTHRYFFKIYALDTMLDLKRGVTKTELLKAMEGHILDQGEMIGLYQRIGR